jgi:hypothetical protein
MEGYTKGCVGPTISVYYNRTVVVSLQGYCKGSVGPSIMAHYNGKLEAYVQGYEMAVWGVHNDPLYKLSRSLHAFYSKGISGTSIAVH